MNRKFTIVLLLFIIALLPSCMPAQDRPALGQTEYVNGMAKNFSPIGLKVFDYDGIKFTPLEEKQTELIYPDDGTIRSIPLCYYADEDGGVIISSNLHAADITELADIDLRKALPVSDTFEVLYAVAADTEHVLLAVNGNGTIDTLLADLITCTVVPLISSDKLYASAPTDGLCATRCAPLQLSKDGRKLLFISGPSDGKYALMCYDFTSGGVLSFDGAAVSEAKIFAGCDIRWLDGDSIAVSYPDMAGTLEVYSLPPANDGESVNAMAMMKTPSVTYKGSYANGWSFEQSNGTLTLTRISDSYSFSSDMDVSTSDFKPENVAVNSSGEHAAIYSKGIIYIIKLTDGSVSTIDAEEKYLSVYETSRPLFWLDDTTLLFNSGMTDDGGQLSVTPVLIKP